MLNKENWIPSSLLAALQGKIIMYWTNERLVLNISHPNWAPDQVMGTQTNLLAVFTPGLDRNCPDYVLYIIVESFLELISQSNAIHLRKSVPVYVTFLKCSGRHAFCSFYSFPVFTDFFFCHALTSKSWVMSAVWCVGGCNCHSPPHPKQFKTTKIL